MDEFDRRILKVLEKSSDMSLKDIGNHVGLFSASAVSKRINSLMENGLIRDFSARIDYGRMGYNFSTYTFVEVSRNSEGRDEIGRKLSEIKGVISVHSLLGNVDFILKTLNRDREDYSRTMDRILAIDGVDHTDTRIIMDSYRDNDYSSVEI